MLPINMDQWAAHRACVQQRDNARAGTRGLDPGVQLLPLLGRLGRVEAVTVGAVERTQIDGNVTHVVYKLTSIGEQLHQTIVNMEENCGIDLSQLNRN